MKKLPILILCGWNLSPACYSNLVLLLKDQGYKVYCPDLPGFGASVLQSEYTVPQYASYISNYVKKNNIQDSIVIGHSFGGRIAIYLAATQKKLFSKIVLTGVPGYPPVPSLKVTLFKFIAKTGSFIFSMPIISMFSEPFKKLLYFSAGSFDYYKASGVKRETFKNIISFKLDQYLRQINTSTLLVWGYDDSIVPVRVAKKISARISDSELRILPNENHGVLYKNPQLFFKTIKQFIEK